MASTIQYDQVKRDLAALSTGDLQSGPGAQIVARLVDAFGEVYARFRPRAQVVEVTLDGFGYLFDIAASSNVAAYGFMRGKHTGKRDASRMSGYPKAEGADFHRGHMIPHTGHGGTDINLFIQRGDVNVGPFRRLEKLAVATRGSFYFVYLLYAPVSASERPAAVEQGLILPGPPATLDHIYFTN